MIFDQRKFCKPGVCSWNPGGGVGGSGPNGGASTGFGGLGGGGIGKGTGSGSGLGQKALSAATKKKQDEGALSNIGTPGGRNAADIERQNAQQGRSTGSAGGLTGNAEAEKGRLRAPPISGGRGLTDGTITGYGPDSPPSLGQIASAVGLAGSVTNPASLIGTAATEDDTNRTLLGRTIDSIFGGTPGTPVPGGVPNHIADSTNRRQDGDTRLLDRASAAARAGLTGDRPDGPSDGHTGGDDGGAEFSSVQLRDRRRPYDEVAAIDLLRGLL